MDRATEPPRAAEVLLSVVLPGGGVRESVLGDLHELYLKRASREGGMASARRWYRAQAIRLALTYSVRRLRRGRPSPLEPTRRSVIERATVSDFIRQILLSGRSLRRSPGFALPALFILAVGMTAATTIFTVVDSIALRPLDFPDSHRIVIACEDHPRLSGYCIASPGNAEDFRREASTIAEMGIGRGWPFHLSDSRGKTGVRGGLATGGFMRALGVQPALGRIFHDEEVGPDNDKVVLLSHAFWTTRYGADPGVLGSVIQLSGDSYEVVGVLPAWFEAPFNLGGIQIWKPPHFDPLAPDRRGWRGFRAIGRLAEGATLAAASAELTGIYAGIAERYDEVDDEWRLRVDPLLTVVVGDTRQVLLAFLVAAGLLLLIVCANVANLVLVRGFGRRQELAVRAALGARRGRLVGEIFTESMLLTALGAVLALVLAGSATRALLSLAPPGIPRIDQVTVDGRVLAFTVLVSVAATVTFAVLPALRVTSWNLSQGLRAGGGAGAARKSTRFQGGLMAAEVALSLVLLSSAGLLTRSFLAYTEWEPGFDYERLLAVSAFVDVAKYPTRDEFMGFFREAEETLAGLPGVTSVATASAGLLFGGSDGATSFATDELPLSGPLPDAFWFDVGPGYFRTLGLPVVRGREFTEGDGPDAELVAIVNEAMAEAGWPGRDPLGEVVRLPERDQVLRIVGVVANATPLTPGRPPNPEIYWPNRQQGRPAPFFIVRTEGSPEGLVRPVRETLLQADPDLSVGTPYTMSSTAERALVRPRFQAVIIVVFALMALCLSAVGVYAVGSYTVARRLREVGIRMALGAGKADVMALMARSGMTLGLIGILFGLVAAALVGRLMRGLLPGVSPGDPLSLGGACAALVLVTLAATVLPARRAAHADPLDAIRIE